MQSCQAVNQNAPAQMFLYAVNLNLIYIHDSEKIQLLKIVFGVFSIIKKKKNFQY